MLQSQTQNLPSQFHRPTLDVVSVPWTKLLFPDKAVYRFADIINTNQTNNHPSILAAYPLRVSGGWSQSQLALGEKREAGSIPERPPVYGHTLYIQRKTTVHTHIHSYGQFRVSNSSNPNLHVFGLWEEGEHNRANNIWYSNQETPEGAEQTTAPLYHPIEMHRGSIYWIGLSETSGNLQGVLLIRSIISSDPQPLLMDPQLVLSHHQGPMIPELVGEHISGFYVTRVK